MVTGRVKAAMGFQRNPKSSLARSLGSYFPRSSTQLRPASAPPEVAELLRAIEELQERESRLRVELLEQKILRETVAIVPFLEAELAAKSGSGVRPTVWRPRTRGCAPSSTQPFSRPPAGSRGSSRWRRRWRRW
jgi:hypothetical protein